MLQLAEVKTLEKYMVTLMQHIQPLMRKSVEESEARTEYQIFEPTEYHFFQYTQLTFPRKIVKLCVGLGLSLDIVHLNSGFSSTQAKSLS